VPNVVVTVVPAVEPRCSGGLKGSSGEEHAVKISKVEERGFLG
jgi:hypothetical protein